jgi:LPXTG-site transpeptidase (sortase) family protein
VPLSGLMILFSVLMFGSAIAIPASRAMQEAEMRDRLAAAAAFGDEDQDAEESTGDDASSDLPVIAEVDVDDVRDGTNAPNPVEDLSRNRDLAGELAALRGNVFDDSDDAEAQRAPMPTRISIPGVEIDAEIHQVGYSILEIEGKRVREWDVASYAAGHHKTSARPGEGGNIVVTGHNDWEGEVFKTLEYAEHGQEVIITTEEGEHTYIIEEIHMRREIGATLEERLETGRFMAEMPEERLTLITCWPYGINDHRIVVVALPAD